MSSLLSLQRNDHDVSPRPFSRIVVAVDPSTASERAVRLALSIARGNARIELVFCQVIDVPRMLARADRFADDYEIALEATREEARSLLQRCMAFAGQAGIFAEACIRYGKPATEVALLADVFAADLIVIGNRPSDRIHRFLCGSVRDEIVRASGIPVLVADANASNPPEFGANCVLAQLADASVSPAALRLASGIAAAYGRGLVCLPPADRSGRAGSGAIEQAVAEHRPALIVIGAPPQGGLRDLFSPNIVERTLQSVDAPVLVVPGGARRRLRHAD
jgi:nucleotide-binding universal stress UspA family protein